MKKLFVLCLMVAASFFMIASACDVGEAAVPNPTITGPIASTAAPGDPSRNYNFFASQFDLAARGYVEEEFFIEGAANRYTIPVVDLVQGTGTILDNGHLYKTRIVVRRPASPAKFTGIVLVEWTNVTNGWDMENTWFQIYDYVLRNGHAWVGVSAQRIGVNYLKTWNAERYGSLTVTPPPVTNDALAYDIFSQAVQAVRSPQEIDPLGLGRVGAGSSGQGHKKKGHNQHDVEVIIATGHSQSASQLSTYVNAVQPLAGVIDAFALHGSLGNRIRTDLEVPVWKVLSEYDVQGSEARVRRPDAPLFATWEVTGTSHNDWQSFQSRVFLERRDIGTAVEDVLIPPAATACVHQPVGSKVPFHFVMAAGLDHLVRWVKHGTPMPSAPPIEVQSFGPPTVFVRDVFGIALGGIRLSQVEVPIAVSNGTNSGPGTCSRWGYTEPFSEELLESLYRNHGQYVLKVTRETLGNAIKGYVLPEDALRTIVDAAHSSVGK